MKIGTRILAFILTVTLFCSMMSLPASAAITSEISGYEYSIQNKYMKVTVNSRNGRFSVRTVEGQPVRKNDQNTFLTFIGGLFGVEMGDSDTSFTTFRISGTDYIFGNDYDFTTPDGKAVKSEMGSTQILTHDKYAQIPEGCQALVTGWSVEGVYITQVLLIYPDTDDQNDNSGNVQVFYNIDNRSGAKVNVGARILLDTMVGANDGPQFQIGNISSNTLSVERMLTRNPRKDQGVAAENQNYWKLPDYWVMKDTLDPTNPLATNVIAYGYTNMAGYRDADYMIVSHWNKLANEKFEEFDDYVAVPEEMSEAASEVSAAQRVYDTLLASYEAKEADAVAKEAAYEEEKAARESSTDSISSEGEGKTKLQLDAEEARATANKVKTAFERAKQNLLDAKANFESRSGGRKQIGDSMIDPNLDFTVDTNKYGSADSAVAFYWSGEGTASVIPESGSMQLGTVFGLGEIIDPASVLAITFPDPVTQVEIDPNNPNAYKNYGIFDVKVEVENLAMYDMKHDYIDITMTLDNNLKFVKYDEDGKLIIGANGLPQTSYSKTQTLTYQKAVTPEQAEKGETNPILPGEKVGVTFKVMAIGKSWPTTRQYMVTATSPQLEMEFENRYGASAGDDIRALYNSSRSNFVFLPAIGHGTPSYSVSVSPDECYTEDPKYITVNMTNIEAYNSGSSVRGQETSPNFNVYLEEVVTGKRYQVDVTDNVQCVVTDDGLTGDMRITYTNGTLVNSDGIVIERDLGSKLPAGEYRVVVDYISTDDEENSMLDMVSAQTFLVTTNDEARIREPGVLAVVKETIPFDDDEIMQKITELVTEIQNAIDELSKIADKLGDTDWTDAAYDEVVDLAEEIISPVTQIYDSLEKIVDFSDIEDEMRALSKDYKELEGVDFSSIENYDLMKAIKGTNVDISLSDYFKELFDVDTMILGPLGLSGLTELGDDGIDGLVGSVKNYGKSFIDPFSDIYGEIVELGDFKDLSSADIAKLKSTYTELQNVDFNELKKFDLAKALKGIYDGSEGNSGKVNLADRFKKLTDIESLILGPFASGAEGGGVEGIYDSILVYGKDMVAPIVNIYDEVMELGDFSTLTDAEIAELKEAYSELKGLDFSQIENLDLDKLFDSINVSVKLSDKIEELIDVEKLVGGPFASLLSNKTGEKKSLGDQLYDWVLSYANKMAAPLLSIYDDIEELADFSDIEDEMRELAKTYPELADIDFSSLKDFDFAKAISGNSENLDEHTGLKDNFKKIFDYETILAGPFSGIKDENGNQKSAMDVFEDRITAYGDKMVRPIVSIYEDIENLANFDNVVEDMKALSNQYGEIKNLDFSCLKDFDVEKAINELWGTKISDNDLSDGFMKTVDAVTNGPLVNGKITQSGINKWVSAMNDLIVDSNKLYDLGKKAYEGNLGVKEGASEILSLYKKYVNPKISVDFDAATSEAAKPSGQQKWTDSEKLALAFMAMYAKMQGAYKSINAKYNKAKGIYNDVTGIKDDIGNFVAAIGSGDVSKLLLLGKDMLQFVFGEWLDPANNAINSAKALYDISRKSYEGKLSVKEGGKLLMDFYEEYLDVSVSADFDGADGKKTGTSSENAENAKKLGLAFMAMYAKMQRIYESIDNKVDRAAQVYNEVDDMIDTVIKVGGKVFSGDFSAIVSGLKNAGPDMFSNVLDAWLMPIMDTIESAKSLYKLSESSYKGEMDAKEGAKLLMDFFGTYLDIDVDGDFSVLKSAGGQTYTNYQKMSAAFMIMYARLGNIFNSIESKVDRATKVYNDTVDVVNTTAKIVKAIGAGDFSDLPDKIMEVGKDAIGTVINYWIGQFQNVIDGANELNDIAMHSYKGDISAIEGAKRLVNFYENYLNVSAKADFTLIDKNSASLSEEQKQAKMTAVAFEVMYVQLKSLYSDLSSKIDKGKSTYNQAKSLTGNIMKLVSNLADPEQLLNEVAGFGEDSIMKILNAYMDKINEMIDSVEDIYDVGKKAYEGKISVTEGAEELIGFFQKYFKVSISADFDAIGEDNKKTATDTYIEGKQMALAFVAMFVRMKNMYSQLNSKMNEATSAYDDVKETIDSIVSLFTDPANGAYALLDLVKARIMKKLDGLGMYKDMFMEVLDVVEDFDKIDGEELLKEAGKHVVDVARVKADQALYTEIYGLLMTGATALDPNSNYDWDPGTLLKTLPTYRLMAFEDENALKEYQDKVNAENKKKKEAAKKGISDPEKAKEAAAKVGNDGVMVKVTGMIRQIGEGNNVTDYIVDTSSEPAIINDTVAFTGSDLIFTNGKLKINVANFSLDAGEYISKAQSVYGSNSPLFDTLTVSGTGKLFIEGSGYVFHDGEWSLDFYNGFDKILDPVEIAGDGTRIQETKKNDSGETDFLNETAAWAIGAINDLVNPLKALAIKDVYFNRHTLFSAPSFSVAGFGLTFDNYLLRSSEVCFGGHIDFKIVTGEIQNVYFDSSGLQSIEADLNFDLGKKIGLLEQGEAAGGNLIIHYYDPDYRASFETRGYPAPTEKYQLDFGAKLKSVGGVDVLLSFKRVADGRILPDIIGFGAQPPSPGILVTGGTYLTELRGAIKELAETIAGGTSTVPLTVEAGVDVKFGQSPATFDGNIDMLLKMTGIEFNGALGYKGKPMITKGQIKAQWVTPWFVSAAMEMDVMGLNVIIGNARIFIGQNLELNRTDFEGFVSAALQIPNSVPVVGGFQLGQVAFGLDNDKIWGNASVGVKPIAVGIGITYYWGGGIEIGTDGEGLPDAYTFVLLEKPEEEPVLIAIGSGMQTEATSWINDNTIHQIEYHAVGDGVSIIDNGKNDIGIGGIEVTDEGRIHIIPVEVLDSDRDAIIEVEYYGDDVPELKLVDKNNDPYAITYGTVGVTTKEYSAFKQELETADGVTRKLAYIMLPRTQIVSGNYTLTSSERVQTKLLSTPTASSISNVELKSESQSNTYTAKVVVDNRHEGDTLSLYLTKEPEGTEAMEKTVKGKDGKDITVKLIEDNDPGVMIFDGIPVKSDTVTLTFDVSNISGDFAVRDLGDIRTLLESGNYYLRAALKSETAYSAMTSTNQLRLDDPKAPGAVNSAKLVNSGNGFFDLSFDEASNIGGNTVDGYRVDFYDENGVLYNDYNGIIFTAEDIADLRKDGVYTIKIGGRAVTSGSGTAEEPYKYIGLETGKKYTAKVYAYNQTEDENYHYAAPSETSLTMLPAPVYAKITSLTSDSGTVNTYSYKDPETGMMIGTTAKHLVTNRPSPTLKITTDVPAVVEAYNGDTYIATATDSVIALDALTVDGDYAIELRLTNPDTGDLSVSIVYVTIDTIEPAIFVTTPATRTKTADEYVYDGSGNVIGVNEVHVTGSMSVDFRIPVKVEGITEAGSQVTANGTSLSVDENGKFSGSVTLPSTASNGEIKISATDKAGNVNTAKMTVTNKSFGAPLGLSIIRTGTMKVGESDKAEIYLKYADKKVEDGKNEDGSTKYRQNYRSESLSEENMDRMTFKVEKGDAISISDDGVITAIRSGAALISAQYKVTDTDDSAVLSSTMAVLVEDTDEPGTYPNPGTDPNPGTNPSTGGGGSSGGGGSAGGGGGSAGEQTGNSGNNKVDIVINNASGKNVISDGNSVTVSVTEKDNINTSGMLDIKVIGGDNKEYVLNVANAVASGLAGENGVGVSFSSDETGIYIPGNALTGEELTVSYTRTSSSGGAVQEALEKYGVEKAFDGTKVKISGAKIDPEDRASIRIEIPPKVKASDVTAVLYIDENGNYINVPAKISVAGSTAYIVASLPGNGELIPVKSSAKFADVSTDFWGFDPIAKAAERLLVMGVGDGIFNPAGNATRAEFGTIIIRSGGVLVTEYDKTSYKDVFETDWYYDSICIANALGILKGDDGHAYPNNKVSRVEGMAMACRMMKLKGLIPEMTAEEAEEILSAYADADEVPEWARIEVAMCIKSGIIVGSDGKILPNANLDRTQAAAIAVRISEAITKDM